MGLYLNIQVAAPEDVLNKFIIFQEIKNNCPISQYSILNRLCDRKNENISSEKLQESIFILMQTAYP